MVLNRQLANSSSYYCQIHDSGAHHTEINVLKISNFKEIHSKIVVDVQSIIPNLDTPMNSKSNRNFSMKSSDSIEINAVKLGLRKQCCKVEHMGFLINTLQVY